MHTPSAENRKCNLSLSVDRTACMFVHSTGKRKCKFEGCIEYVSLRNASFSSTVEILLLSVTGLPSTSPPEGKKKKKKKRKRILAHIKHTALHITPRFFSPCTILPFELPPYHREEQRDNHTKQLSWPSPHGRLCALTRSSPFPPYIYRLM